MSRISGHGPGATCIAHASTTAEIRGVQSLIREFTDWAFSMSEDARKAVTFMNLEKELSSLPGSYAPPTGCLLLASGGGEHAGCVGMRRFDKETAEVKRMYVRPAFRGQGVGGQLLAELVATSRLMGYSRLVLSTHPSLQSAQRIYHAAGFVMVHKPENFPAYEDSDICMEMILC